MPSKKVDAEAEDVESTNPLSAKQSTVPRKNEGEKKVDAFGDAEDDYETDSDFLQLTNTLLEMEVGNASLCYSLKKSSDIQLNEDGEYEDIGTFNFDESQKNVGEGSGNGTGAKFIAAMLAVRQELRVLGSWGDEEVEDEEKPLEAGSKSLTAGAGSGNSATSMMFGISVGMGMSKLNFNEFSELNLSQLTGSIGAGSFFGATPTFWSRDAYISELSRDGIKACLNLMIDKKKAKGGLSGMLTFIPLQKVEDNNVVMELPDKDGFYENYILGNIVVDEIEGGMDYTKFPIDISGDLVRAIDALSRAAKEEYGALGSKKGGFREFSNAPEESVRRHVKSLPVNLIPSPQSMVNKKNIPESVLSHCVTVSPCTTPTLLHLSARDQSTSESPAANKDRSRWSISEVPAQEPSSPAPSTATAEKNSSPSPAKTSAAEGTDTGEDATAALGAKPNGPPSLNGSAAKLNHAADADEIHASIVVDAIQKLLQQKFDPYRKIMKKLNILPIAVDLGLCRPSAGNGSLENSAVNPPGQTPPSASVPAIPENQKDTLPESKENTDPKESDKKKEDGKERKEEKEATAEPGSLDNHMDGFGEIMAEHSAAVQSLFAEALAATENQKDTLPESKENTDPKESDKKKEDGKERKEEKEATTEPGSLDNPMDGFGEIMAEHSAAVQSLFAEALAATSVSPLPPSSSPLKEEVKEASEEVITPSPPPAVAKSKSDQDGTPSPRKVGAEKKEEKKETETKVTQSQTDQKKGDEENFKEGKKEKSPLAPKPPSLTEQKEITTKDNLTPNPRNNNGRAGVGKEGGRRSKSPSTPEPKRMAKSPKKTQSFKNSPYNDDLKRTLSDVKKTKK